MVFLDCIQIVPQIDIFVRSGDIYLPATGTFRDAGQYGYWWSSRSYSTVTDAYRLGFHATIVSPSLSLARWYAFPLRCLSTVLGM